MENIKELMQKRKLDEITQRMLDNVRNQPPQPDQNDSIPQPPGELKIVYPAWFEKNNPPEWYEALESIVESGKPIHLLFTGIPGSGKTELATIITEMYEKHCQKMVLWYNASKYYKRYLDNCGQRTEEQKFRYDLIMRSPADRFVLDDLGTENISPTSKWFYEQFITRHDEYVKRKEAKFSIITTNLDQIAIAERYGSRALDRLLQNCAIFKFKSESFRRRDKKIYNADQMEIIT